MTYFSQCKSTLNHAYKYLGLGALALASMAIAAPASAQRVQPMSYTMAPSGNGASQALRIENTTQKSMTVELTAHKVSVDEYGSETKTPAEDDFLIFPPQAIIKPGKTQTVRVKYIGDPKIKHSEAYRISVGQLPVDLGGSAGGAVGFVINFHTLATIAPQGSQAELHVSSLKPGTDGNWDIAIENKGNLMGRLSRSTWTLSDSLGHKKTLTEQEISQMTKRNLVMPGKTLRLSIPAMDGFNLNTTSVDISVRS